MKHSSTISSSVRHQPFPEDRKAPQPPVKMNSMEVHHHGHVQQDRKWKEYLFQFFMLFLAVFCGFLAEYFLEHKIESDRERQYVQSFYEDLTADEQDLSLSIQQLNNHVRYADSLEQLLTTAGLNQPANLIYIYLREIARGSQSYLYPNDRTMVQLRNAGGMRLIQNKAAVDSMVSFYRAIEIIRYLEEEVLFIKRQLRDRCTPLMNATDFFKTIDATSKVINPEETIYLRSNDPNVLNDCAILVHRIGSMNRTLAIRKQRLKQKASRIKDFIKKAYVLEG